MSALRYGGNLHSEDAGDVGSGVVQDVMVPAVGLPVTMICLDFRNLESAKIL